MTFDTVLMVRRFGARRFFSTDQFSRTLRCGAVLFRGKVVRCGAIRFITAPYREKTNRTVKGLQIVVIGDLE